MMELKCKRCKRKLYFVNSQNDFKNLKSPPVSFVKNAIAAHPKGDCKNSEYILGSLEIDYELITNK